MASTTEPDLPADASTTGVIARYGNNLGRFEQAKDSDWYRVDIDSAGIYRFQFYSWGGVATALSLASGTHAPVSTQLIRDVDGLPYVLLATFDQPSTAYVAVTGAVTGQYAIYFDGTIAPDETGGTKVLALGTPLYGALQAENDTDVLQIQLTAGVTYGFNFSETSTYQQPGNMPAAVTSIDGPGAFSLNDVTANSPYHGFGLTPKASGLYTITIGTAGAQRPESYQWQVNAVSDDYLAAQFTTAVLAVGANLNGTLNSSADEDGFRVTLSAGQRYLFNLTGHAKFALLDAAGNPLASSIAESDFGNALLEFVAPVSATYILNVNDAATSGTYTIAAAAIAADDYPASSATTGSLPANGSISGKIELAGDSDWFKVNWVAGTSYFLAATGLPPSFPSFSTIVVSGPGGTLPTTFSLDYPDSTSSRIYTPTVSGEYILAVTARAAINAYQITSTSFIEHENIEPLATQDIALEASRQGRIDYPGDTDIFRVLLKAGHIYRFILSGADGGGGTAGSMGLTVMLPGVQPTQNFGTNSRIDGKVVSFIAPIYDDWYRLAVSGSQGSYTLETHEVDLNAPPPPDDVAGDASTSIQLAPHTVFAGTLETPGDIDAVRVSLRAGDAYTFVMYARLGEMVPYSATATMELVPVGGGAGVAGVNVKTPYSGLSAGYSYIAPATGDYLVKLSGPGIGAYTLNFRDAAHDSEQADTQQTALPRTVGGAVEGLLDYTGDIDWFSFSLLQGRIYVLHKAAVPDDDGAIGSVSLVDGVGNQVTGASSEYVKFTVAASGTYYVPVKGIGPGHYIFTISEEGAPVVDSTAPRLTGNTMPSAAAASLGDDLVLLFDETVVAGASSIVLKNAAGIVIESFGASALHFGSNSLRIDPAADLLAGTSYSLELADGSVQNLTGLPLATVSLVFRTADAPKLVSTGVLAGGSGNDQITGSAGFDTAVYDSKLTDHTIGVGSGGAVIVTNLQGTKDIDTLRQIERIQFSDGIFALDVQGTAGSVYRLYQAAFDRTPDKAGLGFWIAQADKGSSLRSIAEQFLNSAEAAAKYANAVDDGAFATQLYGNVLHRAPDAAGLAFWVNSLHVGVTRTDVLAQFSESAENASAVAAIVGVGFAYTPYGI